MFPKHYTLKWKCLDPEILISTRKKKKKILIVGLFLISSDSCKLFGLWYDILKDETKIRDPPLSSKPQPFSSFSTIQRHVRQQEC